MVIGVEKLEQWAVDYENKISTLLLLRPDLDRSHVKEQVQRLVRQTGVSHNTVLSKCIKRAMKKETMFWEK